MNIPFLYRYPVPLPPPYPHPVTKGVLGGELAGEYGAYRDLRRRPFWQSKFGPGHQCRPEATEARCKTLDRGSLWRQDLRGCCGVLKPAL